MSLSLVFIIIQLFQKLSFIKKSSQNALPINATEAPNSYCIIFFTASKRYPEGTFKHLKMYPEFSKAHNNFENTSGNETTGLSDD